jgi:competence protein ComEC
MVKRIVLNPVLCAASGAAIGFYLPGILFPGTKWIFVFLIVPVALLCLFRVLSSLRQSSRSLQVTALFSIAFAAGIFLGVSAAAVRDKGLSFGIPDNMVEAVKGELLEDPRIIIGGRAMATISLIESAGSSGLRVSARGELPVFFPEESAPKLREFGRGAVIFAQGTLRNSRGSLIFSAESLHIVKPASLLERFRTGIRMDLIGRFDRVEWGGLALALLVGIRDSLDSSLTALYRDAGCSYVLALSGMHLAVLISIISLFLKKPLGLKKAAIAGAIIIIAYCFMVGPMPSLDRSLLMYLLGVLAVLGALPREPMSLLGMAFILQIVISPRSGYSISFTLSYLALAGILIIGEAAGGLLAGKVPAFLHKPLSASIGAFLATAGITAYFFGVLRPAGIITGLVLVPLTTIFMIAALIWLALNFFLPMFAVLLDTPLTLLYRIMEKTVSMGSIVPGIDTSRPLIILAVSLAVSLLIVWLEQRRRRIANQLLPFN